MGVAIIAAATPALRPLWAKSAIQKEKNGGQVRWPNARQRLNSTYAIMDQQMEADPLSSRLKTRITAQGSQNPGDVGSKATVRPDDDGTIKTSHINMKSFRQCEGKWIPEDSSPSDGERRAEDLV